MFVFGTLARSHDRSTHQGGLPHTRPHVCGREPSNGPWGCLEQSKPTPFIFGRSHGSWPCGSLIRSSVRSAGLLLASSTTRTSGVPSVLFPAEAKSWSENVAAVPALLTKAKQPSRYLRRFQILQTMTPTTALAATDITLSCPVLSMTITARKTTDATTTKIACTKIIATPYRSSISNGTIILRKGPLCRLGPAGKRPSGVRAACARLPLSPAFAKAELPLSKELSQPGTGKKKGKGRQDTMQVASVIRRALHVGLPVAPIASNCRHATLHACPLDAHLVHRPIARSAHGNNLINASGSCG